MVLTTGTFMEGRLFIGEWSAPGGRLGEPAAHRPGQQPAAAGLHGRPAQDGHARARPARLARPGPHGAAAARIPSAAALLLLHDRVDRPSVPCWITYTTAETHRIIRENIHRSPLYGGKIVGRGPRYCPSIEDKVVRFPERARHQVFVEPEGLGTDEVYLNGVSSSLPEDVQEAFLRTIPGLEQPARSCGPATPWSTTTSRPRSSSPAS